jgi:hypothetical protein
MNKDFQPLFKPQIRAVELTDFPFIRSLASQFPTFTVPSEYILWFLTRFHPDYCRVLEQDEGDLKAYLLAMRTSDPPDGIAIWQVAAATPSLWSTSLLIFAKLLNTPAARVSHLRHRLIQHR